VFAAHHDIGQARGRIRQAKVAVVARPLASERRVLLTARTARSGLAKYRAMRSTRPRGYVGSNHETIGSDVLSLYRALLMPQQILGEDVAERIAAMDPNAWYPIAELLDPLEQLADKLGPAALRKIGRELFALSHEQRARELLYSARDVVFSLDTMYRAANRGEQIGGWKVLAFEPGVCELEKTTPHHCALEEGIIRAAMQMVGIPVDIEQPVCLREGADHCRIVIRSSITDARWSGA
jgi:hypothetical protein